MDLVGGHLANASALSTGGNYGTQLGTIDINAGHVERSQTWLREFDRLGVSGGIEHMLSMYFSETATPGAQGGTGVVIDRDYFVPKVVVPLLVTYTGLLMTTEQRGALRLLGKLMSVPHFPESCPMKTPQFLLRFEHFTQTLAQKGQMTSKVSGVSSSFYDILVELEKRVAGFSLGDQELLLDNEPHEVAKVLAKKIQALETTWGLTLTYMHAHYAAMQPSVTQLMLSAGHLHQPSAPDSAKLLQLIFMEHIMCGAFNRSLASVPYLLGAVAEYIDVRSGDFLAVVPQAVGDAMDRSLEREKITVATSQVRYNTSRPSGVTAYSVFGTATVAKTGSDTLDVDTLKTVSGRAIFVPIRGTPGSEDSCDAPLVRDGVKRLFYTVGACPDSYNDAAHIGFFGDNSSNSSALLTPKVVTDRTPAVTYFVDYDTNSINKTTLAELHQVVANNALFLDGVNQDAWLQVFSADHVGYVDEHATAALLDETPAAKRQSPLMMYETNPRYMWIKDTVDVATAVNKHALVPAAGAQQEYVYHLPRGVLGNCSPCSSFGNEMVGSVGSLAHIVNAFSQGLTNMLDYTNKELGRVKPVAVRTFRTFDIAAANNNTATLLLRRLKEVVNGDGILTDPFCQLVYLQVLEAASQQTAPIVAGSTAGSPASLAEYLTLNASYLYHMKDLIVDAIHSVKALIATVFPVVAHNAVLGSDRTLVGQSPAHLRDVEPLYTKFMYGLGLPAVSSAVASTTDTYSANIMAASASTHLQLGAIADGVFVATGTAPLVNQYVQFPYGGRAPSIFRPLFLKRYTKLMAGFAGSPTVKCLALMHWWTCYSQATMTRHLDQLYYSGLSYKVVRQVSFTGHTVTVAPLQGARLMVGNRAAAFPLTTWQHTEYKQTMELAIAPHDLSSMGVSCPNVFMSNINGLGSSLDFTDAESRCGLVFDNYNDHLPEGLLNYQTASGMLSAHGRFDACEDLTATDKVTGTYTVDPTSFFKTSVLFRTARDSLNGNYSKDSSMGLMDKALACSSFVASVPQHLISAVANGLTTNDLLKQATCSCSRDNSIFNSKFGGLFTDDFTVGCGSSSLLRDLSASGINQDVTPRVSSIGGLNANASLGQRSEDPKFMNAFAKNFSAAQIPLKRFF